MPKYQDRDSWNRVQQLNKMKRMILDKISVRTTSPTEFWNQLIGEEKYKQWPEGVHRSAYLSKDVNAFIEVFTDCEFSNYYNMENIMKGKVKAFPGMTLRGRILTALDAAIGQHLA